MLNAQIRRFFQVVLLLALSATTLSAQVLYNFGKNAGDPLNPLAPGAIAQGLDGNLYSTTPAGGHAVIFLGWLHDFEGDTNRISGFRYFSSNLSGNGVGYGQIHFSDSTANGHGALRHQTIIGRVEAIQDYRAFNRAKIPQRNAYAPTQPEHLVYLPSPK